MAWELEMSWQPSWACSTLIISTREEEGLQCLVLGLSRSDACLLTICLQEDSTSADTVETSFLLELPLFYSFPNASPRRTP